MNNDFLLEIEGGDMPAFVDAACVNGEFSLNRLFPQPSLQAKLSNREAQCLDTLLPLERGTGRLGELYQAFPQAKTRQDLYKVLCKEWPTAMRHAHRAMLDWQIYGSCEENSWRLANWGCPSDVQCLSGPVRKDAAQTYVSFRFKSAGGFVPDVALLRASEVFKRAEFRLTNLGQTASFWWGEIIGSSFWFGLSRDQFVAA